jgi:hypothetical protein
VRDYVLGYIMAQSIDAKGKFPKLMGKTTVMSARANPISTEIINEEAVPARYKTAVVEMPLELWQDLSGNLTGGTLKAVKVDKTAIKEAILAGEEVLGADLQIGKYSLVVR